MFVNCQQFAASGAKPFSKFSLIWAEMRLAVSENTATTQRVKNFFIFLGLNYDGLFFRSLKLSVDGTGKFFLELVSVRIA